MISILDMDATGLAEKIKQGELSSLEVTKTFINRLKEINPQINCLVEDRFEEACQEAQKADETLKDSHRDAKGRLFGVPISMKESFHVAGMKTTGGLPNRKHLVASEDADAVASLKREGAIIIGKTNTPVLCFCQETNNKLYGRTNNPWGLDRTAGGSSGGEGALIASGGAAVGLGSDIGGSIRFPSHFNGVIGFKTGNGQASHSGHFPLQTHPLKARMEGIGALAKSVRDARLINDIVALHGPDQKDISQFTVVVPRQNLLYPVNPATGRVVTTVSNILSADFPVVDEQPPGLKEAADLWQSIMSIDGGREMQKAAAGGKTFYPLKEYCRERCFNSSDFHRYFTWGLITARISKPGRRKIAQIEKSISEGDRIISEYLANRLLILPVYHRGAPPHGQVIDDIFSLSFSFRRFLPFVAFANAWGLPALTIPVGIDDDDLPIGLQIISRVGNEDALFQLGELLEQRVRGYKRSKI